MRIFAGLFLFLAASALCSRAQAGNPRLHFLGFHFIPTGTVYQDVEIGGLSALTYDPAVGEFFAVSDEKKIPRIYRFKPHFTEAGVTFEPTGIIPLTDGKGAPFPPYYMDCEGITLNRGLGFFVTSEGRSYLGSRIPSLIRNFNPAGNLIGTFRTPSVFVPEPTGHRTQGARNNLGFESLTLLPSANLLFTATESALIQDDTRADFSKGSLTRILRMNLRPTEKVPSQQFAYWIDPMTRPLTGVGSEPSVGLSDMLAFAENHFISLERGFARVNGEPVTRIRLYWNSIQRATDVSRFQSLRGQSFVPAKKTLLMDWDGKPGLENFEGLSFGPLMNGKRTLVMVADNNFSQSQRTAFAVFSIEE